MKQNGEYSQATSHILKAMVWTYQQVAQSQERQDPSGAYVFPIQGQKDTDKVRRVSHTSTTPVSPRAPNAWAPQGLGSPSPSLHLYWQSPSSPPRRSKAAFRYMSILWTPFRMVFRVALQSVVWACSWHLPAAVRKRTRRTASRAIRAAPGRARPTPQRPRGAPGSGAGPGLGSCGRLHAHAPSPAGRRGSPRAMSSPAGRPCSGTDAGPCARADPGRPLRCAPARSVVRQRRGAGGNAEWPRVHALSPAWCSRLAGEAVPPGAR